MQRLEFTGNHPLGSGIVQLSGYFDILHEEREKEYAVPLKGIIEWTGAMALKDTFHGELIQMLLSVPPYVTMWLGQQKKYYRFENPELTPEGVRMEGIYFDYREGVSPLGLTAMMWGKPKGSIDATLLLKMPAGYSGTGGLQMLLR